MKTFRIVLPLLLLAAVILPLSADAQCKSFVKKQCLPKVAPFTHNGQLNSAVMAAGQTAELQMTFYSGQEYRILIGSQDVLGKVSFRLLDNDKKEVFNSKNTNSPGLWDFKVTTTQQLTLEINVPESDSPNSIVPTGCVAVLIGFKR